MSPRGTVLKMVLRNGEGLAEPKPEVALTLTEIAPERWTPARRAVADALADGPMPRRALAEESGASPSVISGLIKAGVIAQVTLPPTAAEPPCGQPPVLGEDQAAAAEVLAKAVRARTFAPLLLDGVTGSGKTEVYLEAVAAAVGEGRQALVLMPEIALTPMVTARLSARFGALPGEWHSQRSPAARAALWRAVAGQRVAPRARRRVAGG